MVLSRRNKILGILFIVSLSVLLAATLYFKLFQKQNQQWIMPKELNEISGICFIDKDQLACVQDEKGVIYIYDLESNSIEKKIRFAGKGDYEGIAIAGNRAFVITGDGILYEIDDYLTTPVVTSFPINLHKNEESEAICYDKLNNRLLIALKDSKKSKVDPELFEFDLTKKEFQYSSALKIDQKNMFFKKMKFENLKKHWQPADLTIDPVNNKILVVDAINHNLLEISSNGKLESSTSLSSEVFPHPEGIAVRNDGSIFICNDGNKDGIGTIILFEN
jgi:uncharacterized protein YjiK